VWTAFTFAPWSLHKQGVDVVARSVCGESKVAVFAISYEAAPVSGTDSSSLRAFHDRLLAVVAALPLMESITLVGDSLGTCNPLLWPLRPRLVGAVLVNVGDFHSDEHMASEAFAQKVHVQQMLSQLWMNRVTEKLVPIFCGPMVHGSDEDQARARQLLLEACADAPEDFWSYCAAQHLWSLGPKTEVLRERAPLEDLPAVLACGAFSPAVACQESARRFQQQFLPGSTLAFIPASKVWWFVEGADPTEAVTALLDELLNLIASRSC